MCHTLEKSFLVQGQYCEDDKKHLFSANSYIKSTVKYGSDATLLVILQQIFSNDTKSNDSTVTCMSPCIFRELCISVTTCTLLVMNNKQQILSEK